MVQWRNRKNKRTIKHEEFSHIGLDSRNFFFHTISVSMEIIHQSHQQEMLIHPKEGNVQWIEPEELKPFFFYGNNFHTWRAI